MSADVTCIRTIEQLFVYKFTILIFTSKSCRPSKHFSFFTNSRHGRIGSQPSHNNMIICYYLYLAYLRLMRVLSVWNEIVKYTNECAKDDHYYRPIIKHVFSLQLSLLLVVVYNSSALWLKSIATNLTTCLVDLRKLVCARYIFRVFSDLLKKKFLYLHFYLPMLNLR